MRETALCLLPRPAFDDHAVPDLDVAEQPQTVAVVHLPCQMFNEQPGDGLLQQNAIPYQMRIHKEGEVGTSAITLVPEFRWAAAESLNRTCYLPSPIFRRPRPVQNVQSVGATSWFPAGEPANGGVG